MKETLIRHKFKLLNSERTGITLELSSFSSENMVQKYSVSFDKENTIERITESNISFGEKVSETDFFNRLLRDIQSSDEKTREIASNILYGFLEFEIELFDLSLLKIGIEILINQVKIETNPNTESNLVYGLFEFIWWEKISKKETVSLLEKLIEIDSFYIWSFLESELEEDLEKFNSEKLNNYYSINRPKWNEYHNGNKSKRDDKNDSLQVIKKYFR